MFRRLYIPAALSLAVLFSLSFCFAQPENSSTNKKQLSEKAAISDSQFAQNADQANLAEIKLGKLAEQRGTTEAVKDFGKRMVTDHSDAEANLKIAAAKNHITLPTALNAKDRAAYDQLSKLSGEAFDRAYARDMVRDHAADVAEFRHEANDGKDATIKDFASKTLPTLEEHLKFAHEMLHSV